MDLFILVTDILIIVLVAIFLITNIALGLPIKNKKLLTVVSIMGLVVNIIDIFMGVRPILSIIMVISYLVLLYTLFRKEK